MTITPQAQSSSLSETIFAGGGEMGALMRSHDWSQTSLDPVVTWPQSLKTSIRIILGSRYPMFVWWGQELLNFYNDAYIPMLGKRHPAALGQSAREIWAELWHSLGPLAENVMNRGNPSWNEEFLEIMERNGYQEETYFTFSYSPISNDDGKVGGVFCACTEDTRRVLDDRRLRTLRELSVETATAKTVDEACQISTRVLANNLRDIPFALIYRIDRGSQQAQLISTTNLAIGTPASPSAIELDATQTTDCWSLNSVLATGQSRVIENLVEGFGYLPGGYWEQSPNSAIVLPLTRSGQETLGFIISGISPFRPLDDDYRGFFDLVAGQVTTAIANTLAYEEERKRVEALAELDRAKTVFFNNVSHEFRTPLTLMLGPAEDALADRDEPLPPHQRERLKIIQRNGLRLLKLVNTLLDFSRIESDRAQALYEPTDLATFTAEVASVFRSAVERANLHLVVDCPPLPEPVYVDREMWEKIVLNLLSNAFKFTFEGAIAVRLQLAGDRVELTVQDTGIGIQGAEIPHLFERFYRVKGSFGRTFEGSGIGLSLVQELVKLHNGTIGVSSLEGEGSCFTVSIPTGCAHLPPERIGKARTLTLTATRAISYVEEALRWLPSEVGSLEIQQESHSGVNILPSLSASSSSARILLVDDNADMRDYLKRLLSTHWQVDTAANGAIALKQIQQQPPDLILSDVMMPELDGFGLLAALRTDPQTKSLPIILLSARAGEEAAIEGLEAGADDYLIKPFSARELMARVETQLQMSRLRQEQSANRFKNEFLMTVTHELQAPLAAILGWTRLLLSKPFDQTTMERALKAIERNATTEAKLVKDLLDVSSIFSGKLQFQTQKVNLIPLVQDVVATLRPIAEQKNIQLIETLPDVTEQITVLGESDRLKQVITNVLSNAIKFTPEAEQIKIGIECLDSEAQITIRDTGIGISADFLPYAFDRFTQAEVPSRHSPGGVGIGLAIARHLVELHNGTIEVASDGVGRGAIFTVKLPIV